MGKTGDILEETDVKLFSKSLLFLPEHLGDSRAIVFDESRAVLNEYKSLINRAAPLEDADIDEYLRVIRPSDSEIYKSVIDLVNSFDAVKDLEAYGEIVKEAFGRIKKPGGLGWRQIRGDFSYAESLFQSSRKVTDFELTYGAFKLAIDNNPGSFYRPYARFRLGDILVEEVYLLIDANEHQRAKDKLDNAKEVYRSALTLYPGNGRAEYVWFWLGQLAYDQGDVLEAQESYEELVDNFPDNQGRLKLTDNARFMISVCQLDIGQTDDARKTLNLLKEKHPGSLFAKIAQVKLAHTEQPVRLDQPEVFHEVYQIGYDNLYNLWSGDLRNLESIVILGDGHSEMGRFQKAVQKYDEAIKLYEKLYKNLQRSGNSEEVENRLMPLAFERGWYHKALLNKSKVRFELGELNPCIQALDKLVELEPAPSFSIQQVAHLMRGDSYYRLADEQSDNSKDDEKHLEYYENVIEAYEHARSKQQPLSVNRNFRLAHSYIALKMPNEATRLLEEQLDVLADLEGDAESYQFDVASVRADRDMTYRTLGAIHLRQGNYTEAIKNYQSIQDDRLQSEVKALISQIEKLQFENL